MISRILALFAVIALPAYAAAQTPAAPAGPAPAAAQAPAVNQCPPASRPPAPGSGTVICTTELRFHPINESIIEAQTYLYYIQTPLSRPADGTWIPYNEQIEESLREDFKRPWASG